MSRGYGFGRRASASATSTLVTAAVAVVCSGVAFSTIGTAGEPNSDSRRYSEPGLIDTARGGVTVSSGPVNIGVPPADELKVLEARREAELKRLSEKLKRAAAQRGTQGIDKPTEPLWTTDVATAPRDETNATVRWSLGTQPSVSPEYGVAARGKATVLLMMTQNDGRATDPILCDINGCYVSNGAQAPASYHGFRESLSFTGRLGRGAGECNRSSVCIFRGVDIAGATAMLQPINLKLVRHDRRAQAEVAIDESCRVIDGRLSCSRPVRTSGYTLWVVPERVASEVGPEALEKAIVAGLRTSQAAELPWLRQ